MVIIIILTGNTFLGEIIWNLCTYMGLTRLPCFVGVLYHRWGKLDQAEAAYQRALQLEPLSTQVQENLQMLYRKKAKQ